MLANSTKRFGQSLTKCFHTSCAQNITRESRDPRFFTLYQHAKSRLLDDQRKSGVLSHKMEVNRVRLHFEMTGDGDHYVILLPGALGSTRTDFSHQLQNFNKTDFTLIAIDPRGYGQSIPPNRDWPLEFLQRDADDAFELIKKLGVEKVSILGWSDGGISGMIAAARYPQMVNKLVVWGSNAYITKKDMDVYNGIKDISNWSEKMRSPFLALYGEKYFREQWQNWVDAFQNYYDSRNGDICIQEVEKIKAKTLIVHGLKDPLVPLEHPDFLHQTIKGSRLYIMPEGKHNLHQKYHREFNFLVEHFLKQ
ncbi:valacyclovir hydrolase-like isoform X1 [Mya arenaria]|uniref:valacyclovir hydrolase-like isoform X1 n=1 Tax=Mya arenaria TaxID=6604 RepID=UPI0022E18FC1|nr:valacyclovir hydrolase-like isoform X1 [Mya arenaria]